jgi:hypothetical protein
VWHPASFEPLEDFEEKGQYEDETLEKKHVVEN